MPDRGDRRVLLSHRRVASVADKHTNIRPLTDLEGGTRGTIRGLLGGPRWVSRMASMGFTVGVVVEVVQNLGRGAIIVAVRGTQVALGHREASRVQVEATSGPSGLAAPAGAIKVALAGQPNAGKTTVFNSLTGFSQHVGNWPGKTVENKSGVCRHGNTTFHIVDLPGTYSLTANSTEELIARDYILTAQPDVIVDIVDASSLERSLYLLCELLALPVPVVLGLNMMDVAEQQGIRVEPHVLEAALGLPVVPLIATRNQGLEELVEAVASVASEPTRYTPRRPEIRQDHKEVLAHVQQLISGRLRGPYPPDWVALKLLEGDEQITQVVRQQLGEQDWARVHDILKEHEDAVLAITGGRYEWIERMVRAAITRPRAGQITVTERVDRIATHPVWGILLLLGVLGLVFWVTFGVGSPLQQWLNKDLVQAGAEALRGELANAPWWLSGLLADGVIAGAGMVLSFLPILAVFFLALGVFEEVGYMARGAYVMDRFMHWMGLHGKSFLPLCLGFGCNVPSVMCTRIIDSPRARILTILLTPLVPCTARLTVLAILTPLFFGPSAAWVAVGVVAMNLLLLMGIGFALHRFVLKGEQVAFIMEMPLYHLPSMRSIGQSVWRRSLEFVKKAGSVIVLMSVLIWLLSALPSGTLEASYLAVAGHFLSPVGAWFGLDWRMIVALLTSVVAKENTIATLAILFRGEGLSALAAAITPAAALAFLVVQMTFIPCVATVATIYQETRSWRWTAFDVALLLVVSSVAGFLVYHLGQWM
jgi:ferrous iron transport protein B